MFGASCFHPMCMVDQKMFNKRNESTSNMTTLFACAYGVTSLFPSLNMFQEHVAFQLVTVIFLACGRLIFIIFKDARQVLMYSFCVRYWNIARRPGNSLYTKIFLSKMTRQASFAFLKSRILKSILRD